MMRPMHQSFTLLSLKRFDLFFGVYTVGDAALMLAQLEAASLAMPGETAGEGDCSAFGALCEAKSMLEDFAVEAHASPRLCWRTCFSFEERQDRRGTGMRGQPCGHSCVG
jgi:hypothetical protein